MFEETVGDQKYKAVLLKMVLSPQRGKLNFRLLDSMTPPAIHMKRQED